MATEINLLKNELKERSSLGFGEKRYTTLYIVCAVLLLEFLLYGGLFFYKKNVDKKTLTVQIEASKLDLEIQDHSADLKKSISYQQRLGSLKQLLGEHIFWSPVFQELAKYTYIPVTYGTFHGDRHKPSIILTGTAPTYTDIAKLILGLKKSSKFLNVLYQSGGASTGDTTGFGFTLEIVFDPALLQK